MDETKVDFIPPPVEADPNSEVDPDTQLADLFRDAWNINDVYKSIGRVNLLEDNEQLLTDSLKKDELSFFRTLCDLQILGEDINPATGRKDPGQYILREYTTKFIIRNLDVIKKRIDGPYSYRSETISLLGSYMSDEYRRALTAPMADFFIEQYVKGRMDTDDLKRNFFSYIFDIGNPAQMMGAVDDLVSKLDNPMNAEPGENRARILGNLAGGLSYKAAPDIQAKVRGLFGDELIKFGLDSEDVLNSWGDSIPTKFKEELFEENMQAIYTLESLRPGMGIVNSLWAEYGIADFGRYPIDALIWQFDNKDNADVPYGIVVYPQADHNGAFYTQKNVLNTLFTDLQNMGMGMRIYEADRERDIPRLLNSADKRYGDKNKISFAVLGGHGAKNSIQLGNGEDGDINLEKALGRASSKIGKHLASLKTYFIKSPSVILVSCSTGVKSIEVEEKLRDEEIRIVKVKSGIGHEISALGGKVTAPEKDTGVQSIHVKKGERGELEFSVEYSTEGNKVMANIYDKGSFMGSV